MPQEDYYTKQAGKLSRYEDLAAKNEKKAVALDEERRRLQDVIPLGQPILIGHHSEGKHRRHIKRIDSKMQQAIDADNKADYYKNKVANAKYNNSFTSDAPDWKEKLQAQVDNLEILQVLIKRTNKAIRKLDVKGAKYIKDLSADDKACLVAVVSESLKGAKPEHCKTVIECLSIYWPRKRENRYFKIIIGGLATGIRETKQRIKYQSKVDDRPTTSAMYGPVDFIDNAEVNRVQLVFPGKPDEATRKVLKRHGFRWAPSQDAWQRNRNNAGLYGAKSVLKELGYERV